MRKNYIIPVVISALITGLSIPVFADVNLSNPLSSIGCKSQEVTFGDLVSDAVGYATQASAVLIPAGSFRESTIPAGKAKLESMIQLLQYPEDQIVILDLTGSQLKNALERSVSIYPQKNLGFMQVSGISFTYNPDLPAGVRVSAVSANGVSLVDTGKYRVATTSSLADGAYGYFTVWGKQKPKPTELTLAQSINKFLSGRDSVSYRDINRISVKKK